MKSAEEIAKQVLKRLHVEYGFYVEDLLDGKRKDQIIARALTEYAEVVAEARVSNDRANRTADDLYKLSRQLGRNEALEEAAKAVQTFKWATDNDSEVTELLAHKIRALKKEKL